MLKNQSNSVCANWEDILKFWNISLFGEIPYSEGPRFVASFNRIRITPLVEIAG